MDEYEYTYKIKAPDYVMLDLRGDDGDVELEGWRADIECRTDDGDLQFTDVANANTEIWVEDGDVRLARLTGDLVVHADDGDVTITGCETPHALLTLEDGDVRIATGHLPEVSPLPLPLQFGGALALSRLQGLSGRFRHVMRKIHGHRRMEQHRLAPFNRLRLPAPELAFRVGPAGRRRACPRRDRPRARAFSVR